MKQKKIKPTQPIGIGKQLLSVAKRLQKTASVAGLSALRVASGEKPDAHLLKQSFEQLGVTYIKLGQFIASTPSIFPKDYIEAFADCLDNTTPIGFDEILAVLETQYQLHGGVRAIFASIDKKPIASASIAQVHKAVLTTGETVAIKVQKPNVATIIKTDLGVLQATFWTLEKFAPAFKMANLAVIMSEIKARMMMETDFVAESIHLKRFGQFLAQYNITGVIAPCVLDELTTPKVLVMQYLDGVSLIDKKAVQAIGDPKQIMARVLDTWFLNLVATGEFHADLHAGNLLLLDDGRVAFLDFGLVGKINPNSLKACMALVASLQHNDFVAMAKAMVDIGMTHNKENICIQSLADDLQRLLGDKTTTTIHQEHRQAGELNVLMGDVVALGQHYGIHFPQDFALLIKQLLYFDRFMTTLAPQMDLLDDNRLSFLNQ